MALNADAVRVAGTGEIYYAPAGTTAPTDATTALGNSWKGVGYTSPDGVSLTFSRDTTDIDAWQGSKLRVVTNAEPVTLGFTLLETKTDVLLLAFGGGTIVSSGGNSTYTPDDEGTNAIRSMCVDFEDGAIRYRYYFARVQVEGDLSIMLARSEAVGYELTFGVLDGEPKWQMFSNDTTRLTTGS